MFQDNGYRKTEDFGLQVRDGPYSNCYNAARWDFKLDDILTDTPKNTWCRSPGKLNYIFYDI